MKNVLRYKNEFPITTSEPRPQDYALLGKIEFTLTDGKLTSVELMKE